MDSTKPLAALTAVICLATVGCGGGSDSAKSSQAATNAKTRVNSKDGLTYVSIAPGTFNMGCSPGDTDCHDDESPARQVTLTKDLWIGQTEVTQAAYQRVTGSNPSNFKGGSLPVENITWDQAQAYCQAVGMRLPTEAEWEYAARGGTATARYGDVDAIAWHAGNSGGKTHEVAQKQHNAYGLYDMLGNVWEWTSDWFASYSESGPLTDPAGPASGRQHVLKGASWFNLKDVSRASERFTDSPSSHDSKTDSFGLRCAGN